MYVLSYTVTYISTGLSPRISLVNYTNIFEVPIDTTKVSLYFEIFAYPTLNSAPQITVNNSDLPDKWKIIYRSPHMNEIIHYSIWTHFFVEVKTEDFKQEDSGDYMLTVTNTCFSSNATVTVKGKYKVRTYLSKVYTVGLFLSIYCIYVRVYNMYRLKHCRECYMKNMERKEWARHEVIRRNMQFLRCQLGHLFILGWEDSKQLTQWRSQTRAY